MSSVIGSDVVNCPEPMSPNLNVSSINWSDLFIGTFLGSIFVPFVIWFSQRALKYIRDQFPARKLLGKFCDNDEVCKIFVRDLQLDEGSKLISIEPRIKVGYVQNIGDVWPSVEGSGTSYFLNVLGTVGKTKNIEVLKMSTDKGEWNANIVVFGAQAQKSFDFYEHMENVAYSMDGNDIYDQKGKIIRRENGYGYGLILKAINPCKVNKGHAFLIGGFGTLGTLAAAYYFRNHFKELGKDFGDKTFGVVVRCPIYAGEEATIRLKKMDVKFDS